MQPTRVFLIHIPASSHHNSCIFAHFASICCFPVVPFVKNWSCCLHHYEWYSIHFLFYLPITANLDFDIYFNKPKLSVQSHPLQWCVSSDRSSDRYGCLVSVTLCCRAAADLVSVINFCSAVYQLQTVLQPEQAVWWLPGNWNCLLPVFFYTSPHRFKAQVLLIDTCALITHVAAFANGSKIYLVLEHCSFFYQTLLHKKRFVT